MKKKKKKKGSLEVRNFVWVWFIFFFVCGFYLLIIFYLFNIDNI